jgi:hypothetical protein
MTLKEDLEAAFVSERFTLTVPDIETRAGLRRRRTVLRLSGVSLAVVLVVTAGFLLRPKASPPPVVQPTPSVSASAGVDFEALAVKCTQHWAGSTQGRPLPPLLTRRASGGVGVLFYADLVSAFFCSTGSMSISNPAGEPNPHGDTGFEYLLVSGSGTAVFGWGPLGSVGIDAIDDAGRIQYSERFGRIFFFWDYTGEFGTRSDRQNAISFLLFSHQADGDIVQRFNDDEPELPDSFDRNALTQVCQSAFSRLPSRGQISAAPPNQFAFDQGSGRSMLFFGGEDALIRCVVRNEVRNHAEIDAWVRRQSVAAKPFEQLSGAGFVFGRAPDGAISGEVKVAGGQTVALSIRDGYYAAQWEGNATAVPVRVQVNTASERWVYENGQITKQ